MFDSKANYLLKMISKSFPHSSDSKLLKYEILLKLKIQMCAFKV